MGIKSIAKKEKKWPVKEPRLVPAVKLGANYVALIITSFIVVFPFIWMISTALTPGNEVFAWPPRLIPSRFAWENFSQIFIQYDIGTFLINTIIVSAICTISSTFLNSIAGYAFGKLNFPGRNFLFYIVLASIMIPIQITIVPVFIMFRHIPFAGGNSLAGIGGTGWINTYWALILPGLATTFGAYLVKEAFGSLPYDLLDSGRIDGLSEFKIFWKIYLPLAKPALATSAIFSFTETWNSFVWPLIMTNTPKMMTMQLGLSSMKGQYFTDWHLLMAATVLTAMPCFIVFIAGQKYFTQGVAFTGLKG